MANKVLRAAIIGGGISGLSAANALIRRSIDVTVYEQAPALGEVGAGVFTYPNALRPLERMGLGPAFARVGAKVGPGSEYYRMDGTVVGKVLTTDSSGWNGMYGMHRPISSTFSPTCFWRARCAQAIAVSGSSRTRMSLT